MTLREAATKAARAGVRKRKLESRLAEKYRALLPEISVISNMAKERDKSAREILAVLLAKMQK